jgi:hypothetical protein
VYDAAMATRAKREVCTPVPGGRFTSVILAARPGQLTIGRGKDRMTYEVLGEVELRLGRPRGQSKARTQIPVNISSLRLRARRRGRRGPREIFLGLARGARVRSFVSPVTGQGRARLRLAIRHTDQEPVHVACFGKKPGRTGGPSFVPVDAVFDIKYDLERGGFHFEGGGMTELASPGLPAAAPISLKCACICSPEKRCMELCLSIKVGKGSDGKPLVSESMIDVFIGQLSYRWGCKGGACCIRFRKGAFLVIDLPPFAKEDNVDEILRKNRSYQCYNLYFLKFKFADKRQGCATVTGSETGALVNADLGPPDLLAAMGHELGHGLGLANEDGDHDGVEDHSDDPDNTMAPRLGGRLVRLTRAQCDKARDSPLLKETSEPCPKPS